jgi:hypothetical protein
MLIPPFPNKASAAVVTFPELPAVFHATFKFHSRDEIWIPEVFLVGGVESSR